MYNNRSKTSKKHVSAAFTAIIERISWRHFGMVGVVKTSVHCRIITRANGPAIKGKIKEWMNTCVPYSSIPAF